MLLILVVDLVPLIATSEIDLQHKQLIKLLHKSIQFYQASTLPPTSPIQMVIKYIFYINIFYDLSI